MSKSKIAGSLALVIAGLGILSTAPAEAVTRRPVQSCQVGVVVYEDGSWSGSSVYLGGRKVADRWEVGHYRAADRTYVNAQRQRVRIMGGFPADHGGKICRTFVETS